MKSGVTTGFLLLFFLCSFASAQVPTTMNDFFMPGSQPHESGALANPANCGCHDFNNGYIYDEWQGSMMAHAVVDPLFLATMTVAQQDADSSGDLCLRCHTPTGWLSGRSIPTDGSGLISDDETSVNCKFCHRILHPTSPDSNQYPGDPTYTAYTWPVDSAYLDKIGDHIPPTSANGMYVVDSLDGTRRGPFYITSGGNHSKLYSPFHRRAELCGTCHDVSNPVYTRNTDDTYSLNPLDSAAADFDPYAMFPVERTYSEWLNSAYNTPGGISGTPFGGTKTSVSTCQDCHMPHVTASLTNSGQDRDMGIHDMTGGNTFIPFWLGANGYMTNDVRDSSISRATFMLRNAATMDAEVVGNTLSVTVYNETGHKLPSGYPEGRRIWLNVLVFNASGDTIYQSGAYDSNTGILTHDPDLKVYGIKPGISADIAPVVGLPAGPSFHFVLNNQIFKDNRIPPRGFTNANFQAIQSPPVGYTYADGQYWDITDYALPAATDSVVVTLYYQTTSKEYIEFLLNENVTDNQGQILYDFWDVNGKSAPIVMTTKSWSGASSPNNAPLLNPIADQTMYEDTTLIIPVTASDPDMDNITLSINNLPAFGNFTDNGDGTGAVSLAPIAGDSGIYQNIEIIATDDGTPPLSDSTTFSLTVLMSCTQGFLGNITTPDTVANSTDALIILSADAGLPIPPEFQNLIDLGFGDVNEDGMTNSTDALIILSYDAEIPIPFAVGDPVCLPSGSNGKIANKKY